MIVADDRGSASIVGCCIIAALLSITVLLVHVGSAAATRHRTQAAADLAALAVAGALDQGSVAACAAADPIVGRMGVHIRRCEIEGWEAVVEVAAPVSAVFEGRSAVAVARAGPA